MKTYTVDNKWIDKTISTNKTNISVKTLTLEHHMTAVRMGFSNFFNPLYSSDKLKQGLLEGTLSSVNFFTKVILPLYNAHKKNNKFEISNIVKNNSPLFDRKNINEEIKTEELLKNTKASIDDLLKLWDEEKSPTLIDILLNISKSHIFNIPIDLKLSIERSRSTEDDSSEDDKILLAWDESLKSTFDEIIKYNDYVSDNSNFGTHQGVKGLEFDRVMVIIDDEEAKGFMFSYGKLFGIKELTKGDNENITVGKETGIDRTSRLFYVACSRAKESLAIVAYTDNPELLKNNILKLEWFSKEEIEIIE